MPRVGNSATKVGTATLLYAGKPVSLLMAERLYNIVEKAVALLSKGPHGTVQELGSLGTYNPASVLPGSKRPSEHAVNPPRAIDVAYITYSDGFSVNSLDRKTKDREHLIVEAALRLAGFGVVLGYDYSESHHNHWHCDYSVEFGSNPTASSVRGFVDRALKFLGKSSVSEFQKAKGLEADGLAGPKTLAAICEEVIAVGNGAAKDDASSVVSYKDKEIKYTMIGDAAWVPLRQLAEAIGLKIDTSKWPKIILS